jgi:hypothetical protein
MLGLTLALLGFWLTRLAQRRDKQVGNRQALVQRLDALLDELYDADMYVATWAHLGELGNEVTWADLHGWLRKMHNKYRLLEVLSCDKDADDLAKLVVKSIETYSERFGVTGLREGQPEKLSRHLRDLTFAIDTCRRVLVQEMPDLARSFSTLPQ